MSDAPKLYIAGMGMITPVGFDTASTAAAVRAGVSGYRASDFFTQETRQPITMTGVPDEIFEEMEFDIDEGNYYGPQYDRIIKMAIIALREAMTNLPKGEKVPLILAMPEDIPQEPYIPEELFITNLLNQQDLPLSADQIRCLRTGRAAAIQGLEVARHFLYAQNANYVLLGGSDSYWDASRLRELDEAGRVLAPENMDGFAPGEGACFLLLTRHPAAALIVNDHLVALMAPGNAQEPGHLYSDLPYQGEGLDQAFKRALPKQEGSVIQTIFSSMNGESHWSKEYGVAYLRNKAAFDDAVKIQHPADCYGDLGAAAGAVLVGLAVTDLFSQSGTSAHLVYSSSDGPSRAAVRVEKLALASLN